MVDLDTIGVANLNAGAVITNSRVLKTEYKDKSREPQRQLVNRMNTHIFRELLRCNRPVLEPQKTVEVIINPCIIKRAFRCDTWVGRVFRLLLTTKPSASYRRNTSGQETQGDNGREAHREGITRSIQKD